MCAKSQSGRGGRLSPALDRCQRALLPNHRSRPWGLRAWPTYLTVGTGDPGPAVVLLGLGGAPTAADEYGEPPASRCNCSQKSHTWPRDQPRSSSRDSGSWPFSDR